MLKLFEELLGALSEGGIRDEKTIRRIKNRKEC